MNMNPLAVVTETFIYHGFSNCRTLWEEKFTLGEFISANMKNCGYHNVKKHKETKYSDKYITLDISLKFGSLENMIITSSDPKDNLGRPGKGLITSLVLKTNVISKK